MLLLWLIVCLIDWLIDWLIVHIMAGEIDWSCDEWQRNRSVGLCKPRGRLQSGQQGQLFVFVFFLGLFVCLTSRSRKRCSRGYVTIAMKCCKLLTYTHYQLPFSGEGSLSCHTCNDTENRFCVSSLDRPNLVAFYAKQGMLGTFSNPHGPG